MNHYYLTFPTPLGDFSVAVDENTAVLATAFGGLAALHSRLGKCNALRDTSACRIAREQILAYFGGERRTFDLPLVPTGTAFQQRVWSALRKVPFGETRSYGQLAVSLGAPGSARAVGRANATNPICLIVPCHRVIGADGSLTGFAFGEGIKQQLLAHEQAVVSAQPAPRVA